MSLIDYAMKANEQFARKYDPKLGGRPQPKIAIVTCMDPRLSDLEGILGLKTADMDVIRTGGPAVTEDVLGELVVSTQSLGEQGDPAPQSHGLRVHNLHRRGAKRKGR